MKWNDLPVEIQEKMLEYQVAQGNKKDPDVFTQYLTSSQSGGAFNWSSLCEGHDFWSDILNHGNIDVFFKRYPKANKYPCVMMVDDSPITATNPGERRVVFTEKCGRYIAWNSARTLKDAENEIGTTTWKYASPINDTPKRSIEDLKEGDKIRRECGDEWTCVIAMNRLYFFIDEDGGATDAYTIKDMRKRNFELI